MVNPTSPPPAETALPASRTPMPMPVGARTDAARLLDAYDAIVERTCAFSQAVGDAVRGDPKATAALVHQFAATTAQVFRRWNLEILYLLSVENRLRFSQLRAHVPGVSGRSLSLKLDELESLGLVAREVTADSPPQVAYSLTEKGRRLTRLSFPAVLSLHMDEVRAALQSSEARKK